MQLCVDVTYSCTLSDADGDGPLRLVADHVYASCCLFSTELGRSKCMKKWAMLLALLLKVFSIMYGMILL